ncbi:MAG: CPBP family glutamic-type intramembrane protease [Clostridium sp.]|nr:CPBP family glutamic-type intramembrane protease [Clostridium sp.]
MIFSMLLYAAEHSLKPWGIVLTMLWALPLSVSYIKTKNVFVPMTAHFIVNFLGNGTDVVFTVIRMLAS